jgi:PTS system mannose-specific IID component
MQNLGFAFSVMPMLKEADRTSGTPSAFLLRHLQIFNTHPYLSASILGSVVKAEEEPIAGEEGGASVVQLKKTLMGPFAAIGDTFFWGSLRPFAAVVAVALALMGFLWAPVVFLALYNPLHLYIRCKGFLEGYRLGNQGFRFVQGMNLPAMNPKIRWLSVAGLALFMAIWIETAKPAAWLAFPDMMTCSLFLFLVIICNYLIKKHISPIMLLYSLAIVFFLFSM